MVEVLYDLYKIYPNPQALGRTVFVMRSRFSCDTLICITIQSDLTRSQMITWPIFRATLEEYIIFFFLLKFNSRTLFAPSTSMYYFTRLSLYYITSTMSISVFKNRVSQKCYKWQYSTNTFTSNVMPNF